MEFAFFYEILVGRPWTADSERRVSENTEVRRRVSTLSPIRPR